MGERVLLAFRQDLPGESDEQLTDRARNGDKSAFGELYRRHRRAAESTAWCLLRSKSDADDVVSDAFAGVLSALRNGRGPRDNFRGYLLACVRNGCRSRRTPTVLVEESQLERWNPALEDPERFVEADTVARAFSSLAPRWQHTLWMTEVEQLPPTEVSERLDLSPNAAAALTHRARQAFAEAYLAEHVAAATGKACRKIAPLLPGYVRSQLRELQQAAVERHLINCPLCARAVADLRDVNASLRSLMPISPQSLGAAAAATQAVVAASTAGTVGTLGTVGGLSIGLPSTGFVLKGVIALLLVAPLLSTDSPFSGRGGENADRVAESEAAAPAAAAPDPEVGPVTTASTPVTTAAVAPVTTRPDDGGGGSSGGEDPAVTLAPTIPPNPITTLPITVPLTIPLTIPGSGSGGLVPTVPVVGGLVDDLLDGTVRPIVGSVTEPLVETLDEALAFMGLGSTGETIAMLRSLVPLLDSPLLGGVVDELLDLTSIGGGSAGPVPGGTTTPAGGSTSENGSDDGLVISIPLPGGGSIVPGLPGVPGVDLPLPTTPTGSVPIVSIPTITVPPITIPPITIPVITIPVISLPPIDIPILNLPPITLPVISLPAVSLPPITIPPITIPDLLG